jgi:hypothetical protein
MLLAIESDKKMYTSKKKEMKTFSQKKEKKKRKEGIFRLFPFLLHDLLRK